MTDLRILVVDDAALFRKLISDVLAEIPGVEVVGTAGNGAIALSRIASLRPDLVLLDIEMPEMNGIEVLQAIKKQGLDVGVIIISAFTRRGSERTEEVRMTIRALELGAFDFVTKTAEGSPEQNRASIRAGLAAAIKAFSRRFEIRSILKGGGASRDAGTVSSQLVNSSIRQYVDPLTRDPDYRITGLPNQRINESPRLPLPASPRPSVEERMERLAGWKRPGMVLIGISTGGPNALALMLPRLPADLGVPVFIVQHMPPLFTRSLAESLNERCPLQVKEAEDGETARPNVAYIAPGGRQMKIAPGPLADRSGPGEILIRTPDDPPENNCKPSVDTLFRSAAFGFPGRACAVIMTGMGSDGTLGLRLLKRHACRVIAQDEASCAVFGMPKEAINAGVVDQIVPLESIAEEIRRAVKGYTPL